ncbi:hypothetical protein [Alicyclobacillus sp. SO9]|uniref:hypothetical protein n=1 Tax=Alicyclobacillus sp. SO9 TaxID=2665646 RepID=UPI0018E7F2BE|nr:hypothetical protein [Alicyclobacillus sp. SO9]QQE80637.1 hypothetical protein GI364_09685 [Alicyclobacillus sp. SO9]
MMMSRDSKKYKSMLVAKTVLFSIAVLFGAIMSGFLIFARDVDAFVSGFLFFIFSAWGTHYSDKLLEFRVPIKNFRRRTMHR